MTKSAKTGITVIISIILALLLIWWAMSGLDLEKTWESLRQANYLWVSISVVLGIVAYWLRSERWKLLIEPLGYEVKSNHAFYSVCMNYFWNLVIPRSGELARCTSLYTLDKTPVDKSFGTVISERFIDFVCLMIIGLLAVITNYDLIPKLYQEVISSRSATTSSSNNLLYFILGGILLVSILGFVFRKSIKKLSIYPKIKQFIFGLRSGLKTIFQLKNRRKFILYTFLIWLFYYLMTYLIVFSLPETAHLTPSIGLYLLLVGGIGMVIPASGGFGAYHSAMKLGFIVLGFNGEIGLTFAFLVHTPHTLIALALGLISLIMISIEKSRTS